MRNLLIIVGPTAIGKTALAVKLARQFNGEIISADSRQIYQGMDIGTGKDITNSKFKAKKPKLKLIIQKKINLKINLGIYKINNIPIWGLDLLKPNQKFSVAHWVGFANVIIKDIWKRKKLPIIVGGTGFWIRALIDGIDSIGIPPDWNLRKKLSNLEIKKLKEALKKLDPERLKMMNQSDKNNPRRLIRAIEIAQAKEKDNPEKDKCLDQIPRDKTSQNVAIATLCEVLWIMLKAPNKTLYQQIDQRVEKRVKQGVQKEVKSLVQKGYSWELPSMSALGYKEWQPFFAKKSSLNEVIERWKYNEHAYARRQLTWFKKNKEICCFDISSRDWQKNVVKLVKAWYYKANGKN